MSETDPQPKAKTLKDYLGGKDGERVYGLMHSLEGSYLKHLRFLMNKAAQIDALAISKKVPIDAGVQRFFAYEKADLMLSMRALLEHLDGAKMSDKDWHSLETDLLLEFSNKAKKVLVDIDGKKDSYEDIAIGYEIPDYTSYQLLCALLQVQGKAQVNPRLIESLRRVPDGDGFGLTLAVVERAGITYQTFFTVAKRVGGILLLVDNVHILKTLLSRERPDLEVPEVSDKVKLDIGLVGDPTHSFSEYNYVSNAILATGQYVMNAVEADENGDVIFH